MRKTRVSKPRNHVLAFFAVPAAVAVAIMAVAAALDVDYYC